LTPDKDAVLAFLTSPLPAEFLADNHWHRYIDNDAPNDHWAFSRQMGRLARDEANGLTAQQLEMVHLIAGVASMRLTDGAKPPFQPMMSFREEGRTTAMEDFEVVDVEALAELAPLAPTAALRARFADVAATRGQDIGSKQWRSGAVAVANYLEVVENHLLDDGGIKVINEFLRGLRLAWVYCRRDQETHARFWTLARKAITQSLASDRLGMAFILVRELRKSGGDMAQDVAAELEQTAQRLEHQGEHEAASRSFENAADLWARSGRGDDARRCRLLQGEALISHATVAPGPAFARASWLMDGIEVLRRAGADRARIEDLRRSLANIQHDSLKAFKPLRHSFDASEIVQTVDRVMVGPSFYDCVCQMALHLGAWPTFDAARQQVLESANRHPLSGLFSGVHLNREGAVVARQKALDPEDEESVYQAMVKTAHDTDVQLRANPIVVRAVDILFSRYQPSIFHICEIVAACPLIPTNHEESIARGLFAGINSDWLEVAAYLIPQVEPFVRHQFRLQDVLTVALRDDGVQAEKTLGELLRSEQAEAVLGKSLILELDVLMVHPLGYLLRHNWAHGLVDDDQMVNAGVLALWLTFWRLVLWPELVRMAKEGQPPANAAQDPEEPPAAGNVVA